MIEVIKTSFIISVLLVTLFTGTLGFLELLKQKNAEIAELKADFQRSITAQPKQIKIDAIREIADTWSKASESVNVGRPDLKSAASALYWEADKLEKDDE